jgi:zona occludens toxin
VITLITGSPGTGKTAWIIQELLELKKTQPYREIFIHGIRDFTGFKHTTVYCQSKLCDICRAANIPDDQKYFVENWQDWYKPHFLIVVDEVQRIWSQANGHNCTDAISRLQTHRHYGLDFWLVSQSPKLVHADVKAMVGKHIHLVSRWSGRKQYEFPECRDNTNARTDAVVRKYTLPKAIFKFYNSAEVHTKQEKRKPLAFYAVLIIFCVVVGLGGVIYHRFSGDSLKTHYDKVPPVAVGAIAPTATGGNSQASNMIDISTPEKLIRAYTPVIASAPWSAPVFAELAKPVSFPRVVGCIGSVNKCTCYSQQATIVDMDVLSCRALVMRKSFNQFLPDNVDKQTSNDSDKSVSLPKPINFIQGGVL